MTDERRPQPHPGTLGHAAHLRRFDTAAPWSPAPAASGAAQEPEPAPPARYAEFAATHTPRAYGVASVPAPAVDVVPPEIYQTVPSAAVTEVVIAPPAFVARIPTSIPVARPRPVRRRLQLAVATTVAACALAAVGVGYVAFTRSGAASTEAIAPALPGLPSVDGTRPPGGAVPGAAPTTTLSLSPSAAAPATTATTGAPAPVPAGAEVETTQPVPGAEESAGDSAGATATPEESPRVLRPPPPAPTQIPVLEAHLSYTANEKGNGISGYVGTITLTNSQGGAAGSWQVAVTVPGGNLVSANGPVDVSQRGESVVFTPSGGGGAVPGGGSLRFTFAIRGLLSDLPHGCTIDGRACS